MAFYIAGEEEIREANLTLGFAEPLSSQEIPDRTFFLWVNVTSSPVGERVLKTGDGDRLLDIMSAQVIRETWPKTGGGWTGIYLKNAAGLSPINGSTVIEVDPSGISVGSVDLTGYYRSNAMTLSVKQVGGFAESRQQILLFLNKCRNILFNRWPL